MLDIRSQFLSCLERWSKKIVFVSVCNRKIYWIVLIILTRARKLYLYMHNKLLVQYFEKILQNRPPPPGLIKNHYLFSKVQLCTRLSKPELWTSSKGLISKSSPSPLLRWYKDKGIGAGVEAGHSVRQEGDISNPISINRLTDFNTFVLMLYFRRYEPVSCRNGLFSLKNNSHSLKVIPTLQEHYTNACYVKVYLIHPLSHPQTILCMLH